MLMEATNARVCKWSRSDREMRAGEKKRELRFTWREEEGE